MNIETQLAKIAFEISQAEARLALVRQKMSELEQAGMYPALPTERWKDERYLYLYFANGARGLKLDAKQRLYIGADPTLALVYRQPGSFFDFEFQQLHPGQTFEGQCAVWAVGDYD